MRLIENIIKISVCTLLCSISTISFSQQEDSTLVRPILLGGMKIDGAVKTKLEVSTSSGVMRFNVRNSRLGLRGDISDYFSYRIQVDLSAEGNFSPLDLFGTLKPAKDLSVNLGQTSIPFENSYIITPAEMLFSNRAFVGKYFTPGSRDLGGVLRYQFQVANFPLEMQAGVFNGGLINNPEWTNHPSYAFRFIAGNMDAFRTSVKVYRYQGETLDLFLWGADMHYRYNRFRVDSEVMNRRSFPSGDNLFGCYLQGIYTFDFGLLKMFRTFSPALRWDGMGDGAFFSGFDVSRLTIGLNFGFPLKPFDSVLRFDYEQYFTRSDNFPAFINREPQVADNKFTIELLLRF